jgi:hypothetical protein
MSTSWWAPGRRATRRSTTSASWRGGTTVTTCTRSHEPPTPMCGTCSQCEPGHTCRRARRRLFSLVQIQDWIAQGRLVDLQPTPDSVRAAVPRVRVMGEGLDPGRDGPAAQAQLPPTRLASGQSSAGAGAGPGPGAAPRLSAKPALSNLPRSRPLWSLSRPDGSGRWRVEHRMSLVRLDVRPGRFRVSPLSRPGVAHRSGGVAGGPRKSSEGPSPGLRSSRPGVTRSSPRWVPGPPSSSPRQGLSRSPTVGMPRASCSTPGPCWTGQSSMRPRRHCAAGWRRPR